MMSDDDDERWDVPIILVILGAFAIGWCMKAKGAPPPGTDLNSALHAWFDRQHNVKGGWCCRLSDGHILADDEWRATGNGYQVKIDGDWFDITPNALRDPVGGPNPTGHAIVWYLKHSGFGVSIYCFAPGTML